MTRETSDRRHPPRLSSEGRKDPLNNQSLLSCKKWYYNRSFARRYRANYILKNVLFKYYAGNAYLSVV